MIKVQIQEKGIVIGTLTTEQFMTYAKENFGIGRKQFLGEYIKFFNNINPDIQANTSIK